jgi:hypothetical protein
MITIESSSHINRPVGQVFQFVTNQENAHLWLGGFFKLAQPLLARLLQRHWDINLANIKDVLESAASQ